MSTAEERVALRKQRVLTGGKYEERQTWERFLRHNDNPANRGTPNSEIRTMGT